MAPRAPLQEDRRQGQDEGGEAGWQAWHGGPPRGGWPSLIVPPAAPPSSPRRPPNPPPNGQSRAKGISHLPVPLIPLTQARPWVVVGRVETGGGDGGTAGLVAGVRGAIPRRRGLRPL